MSIAFTDIIVALILLFLAANGTYQGFLRSLIGPLSLILSAILALLVFAVTRHIGLSVGLGILGPFFFSWLFKFAVQLITKNESPNPCTLSRICGAALNVVWGSAILVLVLLALTLVPLKGTSLGFIRDDMNHSWTYDTINSFMPKTAPKKTATPAKTPECLDSCAMTEEQKQNLSSDEDVLVVAEDPRMKKLLNDPEFVRAAQNKDFSKILTNPTVMELSLDPAFLVKAFKAYGKIQNQTQGR